jgi:predicted RNase H-like nuclease (RuvC/YqgF family)
MDTNEKTINTFATRVRQMILQYHEVEEENQELYAMVDEREARIKELERQVAVLQRDYDLLKTARMIEVGDGDIDAAKKRVAKMIRDVNRCITLMSEQSHS